MRFIDSYSHLYVELASIGRGSCFFQLGFSSSEGSTRIFLRRNSPSRSIVPISKFVTEGSIDRANVKICNGGID